MCLEDVKTLVNPAWRNQTSLHRGSDSIHGPVKNKIRIFNKQKVKNIRKSNRRTFQARGRETTK